MKTRKTARRTPRENGSYWISYSDLMAAMLFVFALILFVSLYRLVDLQQTKTAELETKEAQLTQQQSILLSAQSELKDKEELLALSTQQLDKQQVTLEEQAKLLSLSLSQLDEKEKELLDKQSAFDLQSVELEEAQKQIALAQASLLTQQGQLAQQEALLSDQQEKIDNLIGVRARIIEDLRDELNSANLNAGVDRNTGAITFEGAVLFDFGSSELKESGKLLLSQFLPVYLRTLMSGENSEYIGEIIIEGHTDRSGAYLTNLELSQQRALGVVSYCLSDEFTGLTHAEKEKLYEIMTANGRSWSDPIYNADGSINADASRRVEFKFRLKDQEMIEEMSRILENAAQTD
jgi:chemotaxis protein MotB